MLVWKNDKTHHNGNNIKSFFILLLKDARCPHQCLLLPRLSPYHPSKFVDCQRFILAETFKVKPSLAEDPPSQVNPHHIHFFSVIILEIKLPIELMQIVQTNAWTLFKVCGILKCLQKARYLAFESGLLSQSFLHE